ncbi:cytochrome P450 2J6 [Haplochromis burtoni]|uniref:cytochrome P450 2J6 n=1 Tax=Haplochromis burtoni TaxID=8153 RepID=UPI001C2D6B47|nr:cytochrome P450 2J6 [Haplochromis burtoni]
MTMFLSVVLLWICVFFIVLQVKSKRPKNFPPGPPVFPILGTILQLSLENPLKDFERLRKSYGDVYSIYIGQKPAVVINGLKAVKEAMVTKAADFAGRPQDFFINDITKRKGVIWVDYGSSWREHRRFALMTLRNFGLGKHSMEDRIHEEIKYLVSTLKESVGKTMSPGVMFHNAASNIICQVLFARRFEYDDALIKQIVQCFTETSKLATGPWAMLYDSFPIIRNLPLPFQKAFENFETYGTIAIGFINEHKKTRVPGEPRDFIDCYLDELEKVCECEKNQI